MKQKIGLGLILGLCLVGYALFKTGWCGRQSEPQEIPISNDRSQLERELRVALREDSLFRDYLDYARVALSLYCPASEQSAWFLENVPAGAENGFRERWNAIHEKLDKGKNYESVFYGIMSEISLNVTPLRENLKDQNRISPGQYGEQADTDSTVYDYHELTPEEVELFFSAVISDGHNPFK